MTNEIVSPVIAENGIEFYVSGDGEKTGVSISGLSRLCGVDERTIRRIVRLDTRPKALESLPDNLFHEGLTSNQQAKIITAEYASDIILYYAFDSSAANETARYSAKKFAKLGMDAWIKEITGYAKSNDNCSLTAAINALLVQSQRTEQVVTDLTTEVKSWRVVKQYADTQMQGLNILVDEIAKTDAQDYILVSADTPRTWSVAEWLLDVKGVALTSARMKSFGRRVAETYKSLKQQPIKKDYRTVNENNTLIAVYTKEDFPVLHIAFTNYMSEYM